MADWLTEVIGDAEDALRWLREKPRTCGELRAGVAIATSRPFTTTTLPSASRATSSGLSRLALASS